MDVFSIFWLFLEVKRVFRACTCETLPFNCKNNNKKKEKITEIKRTVEEKNNKIFVTQRARGM
jgi:hypothetical protein